MSSETSSLERGGSASSWLTQYDLVNPEKAYDDITNSIKNREKVTLVAIVSAGIGEISVRATITQVEVEVLFNGLDRVEADRLFGYYAVPGGGLDPHESLIECLIRELREETGVTAKPGKLLFIQQFPSSRASYEEELEFFFAVDNPDDFTDIDISQTTHGAQELAVCEYIDPSQHVLYPEFLQSTDIALYINGDQPVLVVDNFNEQHQQLL